MLLHEYYTWRTSFMCNIPHFVLRRYFLVFVMSLNEASREGNIRLKPLGSRLVCWWRREDSCRHPPFSSLLFSKGLFMGSWPDGYSRRAQRSSERFHLAHHVACLLTCVPWISAWNAILASFWAKFSSFDQSREAKWNKNRSRHIVASEIKKKKKQLVNFFSAQKETI